MATYFVEQGMKSPRENKVGWRFWGDYADLNTATREARRLFLSRVTEVKVIAEYESGKRVAHPIGTAE